MGMTNTVWVWNVDISTPYRTRNQMHMNDQVHLYVKMNREQFISLFNVTFMLQMQCMLLSTVNDFLLLHTTTTFGQRKGPAKNQVIAQN